MRVAVLNQYAGTDTIAAEVGLLLRDPAITRMRVLMAFARGGGIGLLRKPLADFVNGGGSGEAIIGLDMRGTSPEALESLAGMGVDCLAFGVRGDRTFHPKVYVFDGESGNYTAVVGSSNWTPGGLDSNFEVCLRVDALKGSSEEDDDLISALERLWDAYRGPAAPLRADAHLRKVDPHLIRELAARLAKDRSAAPDQRSSRASDDLFDDLTAPRAPLYHAPRGPREKPPTEVPADGALPTSLYLEVIGPETGGGREVQVPLATLGEYFGIDREDTYYMTFCHPDGIVETNCRLATYDVNSTYRISSSKFAEVPQEERATRPMIIQLERQAAADTFNVSIVRSGTAAFTAAAAHLDRGGGGSKRWGVVP